MFNERAISISAQKVDIDSFDINVMNPKPTVLYIPSYKNLNFYRQELEMFLENGGSVFMIADITGAQVNDGVMDEIFGLKWNSLGALRPQKSVFYDISDSDKLSFHVARYYENLTGMPLDSEFEDFDYNAKIDIDDNTVLINKPMPGEPWAWGPMDRFSIVQANLNIIKGSGRSAWMDDFDRITPKPDINNLTKAVILWLSDDGYSMDPFQKTIPQAYSTIRYIIPGNEPYAMYLTFWRVFY